MPFRDFFQRATRSESHPNGRLPFPYQEQFAEADELWSLISAPTGAGKTATVIIGWLWRYFFGGFPTPRRLIYCLPMRVLVEQTRDEARKWIKACGLPVKVHVLMGGEDADDWDLEPESPAILLGTQDMLLSRALNHGYGMSRFRWPMHFGLLNNDCLWVLDEIQLMGVGLATSAQLQAFRQCFKTYGEAKTVWMSATLLPSWLETVDFRGLVPKNALKLTRADYNAQGLRERWESKKPIEPAEATSEHTDAVAALIKDKHIAASLTLVVVNTVNRSRELFQALRGLYQPERRKGRDKKASQPVDPASPSPDLKLIHSRFRPIERKEWMIWLKPPYPAEGRIVISTQVVEAGVDMSARTLFTELAPWPSLVQRIGRCNRRGEFTNEQAQVLWIDVPTEDDKAAAPYLKDELDAARQHVKNLSDVGLKSLHEFFEALSDEARANLFPYNPPHVVRRKDFVDLFDTTSDLAGNDIDVSRFIREGDELDVQVFWRAEEPPRAELGAQEARRIAPMREELCPVPVAGFREFVEKSKKLAFWWDALDGKWVKAVGDTVFPGQVFWVPQDQGGYSKELGWDPKASAPDLEPYERPSEPVSRTTEPEYDSDLLSQFHCRWRSIAEHTDEVFAELGLIADTAKLENVPWNILKTAARWHDWGKAHDVFQDAIEEESESAGKRPSEREGKRDIAKATAGFWRRHYTQNGKWQQYRRKHFRHELASALGILFLLRSGKAPADWASLSPLLQNLALYLIAAHHGKIRLSIRSMPDEDRPKNADALFARGVWDADPLPSVDLGGNILAPAVHELDLSPMQLGRAGDGSPSWTERMLGLRNHADVGPLKLAFLEAILRAADMRASKKADEKARLTCG